MGVAQTERSDELVGLRDEMVPLALEYGYLITHKARVNGIFNPSFPRKRESILRKGPETRTGF